MPMLFFKPLEEAWVVVVDLIWAMEAEDVVLVVLGEVQVKTPHGEPWVEVQVQLGMIVATWIMEILSVTTKVEVSMDPEVMVDPGVVTEEVMMEDHGVVIVEVPNVEGFTRKQQTSG